MKHIKILILGGGLTGLSTAYHLEKQGFQDYLLAEKEPQAGGLCRSFTQQGFTYDLGGHLLHLHTPYGKQLVQDLLQTNLVRLKRNAWIYTPNAQIPYPFQAHLHALPDHEKKACVAGLQNRPFYKKPYNFEQWCLTSFGKGIYEQFLKPYNTKLWGVPPKQLTCEWCGPFVPQPAATEIAQSATHKNTKTYGYNSYFYYPKQGGIGALTNALVQKTTKLRVKTLVQTIDLTHKTALVNGESISFDYLVNTLPLPAFIQLLKNEKILKKQAKNLKNRPITVWNVGLKGKPVHQFSWIYFPEIKIPFFRVGYQSGFSGACAPKGTSLFYIEFGGKVKISPSRQKQILNILVQKGIITTAAKPVFATVCTLPYGYALYDKNRTRVVSRILSRLEKQNVYCGGRYGKWEYSFMERSLLEGQEIARKLTQFSRK